MNAEDRCQFRWIGIGLVTSMFMVLIYDLMPIVIEKGLVPDVGIKLGAFTVSIILGVLFLKYFFNSKANDRI